MANKLKVQEQEAINNLVRLGWGIRRISRELGLSRNTVRAYARSVNVLPADVEESLNGSPPGSGFQTDPLSTAGNTGRKSFCDDHATLILAKVELGLTAQRIYQDLRDEIGFNGSYQS